MIPLLFALSAAFAGDEGRRLQLKLVGPGETVVVEDVWVLPTDTTELDVSFGGLPHVVTIEAVGQHDTIVVQAGVYQVKGRSQKRVPVTMPQLIVYQGYPGRTTTTPTPPKGFEGSAYTWTIEAHWVPDELPTLKPAETPKVEPVTAVEPTAPVTPGRWVEPAPPVEKKKE
ncbi:MAG: hypothetical protein IPO67_11315 [Deltaproteobacteria bacterium]|nr:hypothetical protein [Deltaproteobacteria bacterium]